jgi:HSP20 family protein
MAEAATKLPLKTVEKAPEMANAPQRAWMPFASLHGEIDRLFEDFNQDFFRLPLGRRMFDVEPFWRRDLNLGPALPAVDVVEKDTEYQIAAELAGLDESNIELTLSDGILGIKGEKKEESEEKKKDYYLSERRYGSFQRSFSLPDDVDQDKIEASFKKGVLTVVMPKRPEAQKQEKKIAIKAK